MDMKWLRLKSKLIGAFLLVGLLPFFVLGLMAIQNTSASLKQQAFNQLVAVREIKKGQIESLFGNLETEMDMLVATVATMRQDAFSKLKTIQTIKGNQISFYFESVEGDVHALKNNQTTRRALQGFRGKDVGSTLWKKEEAIYHSGFKDFMEDKQYYDIFLVDTEGNVVYTATKESDLGENLTHGPLRTSGLAEAYRGALSGRISFADYQPYAPSNDKPAAFVAGPLTDPGSGKTIGVVAVQLSINVINRIMMERTGLGKTGETYLVGPDQLMRSDSFLDPKHHSVEASFADPFKGKADTEAVRNALDGQDDTGIIIDYNGNPVLSAFAPLEVFGTRWAILSEIDVAEAFAPINPVSGRIFYKDYIERRGHYDLFLMNPDGYVFYTVTNPPYSSTRQYKGWRAP